MNQSSLGVGETNCNKMEDVGNLAYRGEGNCAIVFADLSTLRVYRLVKNGYTKNIRKHFHTSMGKDYITALMMDNDVQSKLENVINYVENIMNPLLSHSYAVIPELISIPKGFGEKAVSQAGESRPAKRKTSCNDMVDPDVCCALVLPDCCFVRSRGDSPRQLQVEPTSSHPKHQVASVSNGLSPKLRRPHLGCNHRHAFPAGHTADVKKSSLYSVKKGDIHPPLLCGDRNNCDNNGRVLVGDLLDKNESISPRGVGDSGNGLIINRGGHHHNDVRLSHLELMDCHRSVFSCVEDSHSPFTISFEIKPKKAFKVRRPCASGNLASNDVCRFCMHQHLKRKAGKWPETSSYCPLDLFSG